MSNLPGLFVTYVCKNTAHRHLTGNSINKRIGSGFVVDPLVSQVLSQPQEAHGILRFDSRLSLNELEPCQAGCTQMKQPVSSKGHSLKCWGCWWRWSDSKSHCKQSHQQQLHLPYSSIQISSCIQRFSGSEAVFNKLHNLHVLMFSQPIYHGLWVTSSLWSLIPHSTLTCLAFWPMSWERTWHRATQRTQRTQLAFHRFVLHLEPSYYWPMPLHWDV